MLYIEQDLKQQLSTHLETNEQLIWAGIPKQGIIFQVYDRFMIPFSVVWCGIIAVWMIFTINSNTVFAFFGIPFVIIGLFMLFGRFFLSSYVRSKTFYGVTNKRIIIKVDTTRTVTTTYDLSLNSPIRLTEFEDETGTITFTNDLPFTKNRSMDNLKILFPSMYSFYKIRNARNVHVVIMKTQKELMNSLERD